MAGTQIAGARLRKKLQACEQPKCRECGATGPRAHAPTFARPFSTPAGAAAAAPNSVSVLRKLLRPLLAGAGAAGALVLLNRGLASGLPVSHLAGAQRRWNWRGYDIFAVEAGEGPPVMLIHGMYAGASSYEFRKLFPLLAQRHRVVALDLLGCGLSDKPSIHYTAELFVEQIADAVAEFGSDETTLVGSSLGAAFAIRAAAHLGSVSRLVAICPAGLAGVFDGSQGSRRRALTSLFHAPVLGESIFNGVTSKPSLRRFLEHRVYGDPAAVTPEIVEHYYAITHQPGARYVPGAFAGGRLDCDVARDLPFVEAPLLVLWGKRASPVNPARNAAEYAELAKNAQVEYYDESGLLPQEEEPHAVAARIERFIA